MKVPVSWLKEFVSFGLTPEKLAEKLTLSGFEVEQIIESEGDAVLEVAVMPNRGDCLSIRGIAREVAAILGRRGIRESNRPEKKPKHPLFRTRDLLDVALKAREGCFQYGVKVVRDLKVAPSPEWMRRRLVQSGLRPINNVVDVTNYVLLESGQPLHAFDLKKIGPKIIIRHAEPGELFDALDGKTYRLEPKDLLIADTNGPIALGGIMGGIHPEVSASTTEVALESAFFNPSTIRKTSRRLGLQTESSYRFERRVDPTGVSLALERASELLRQVASGEPGDDSIVKTTQRFPTRKVSLNPDSISKVLGGDWSYAKARKRIQQLGFSPSGKNRWSIPLYRWDIQEEVDLIEEVVRLEGYEKIPLTLPSIHEPPIPSCRRELKEETRRWMADQGFAEAIHLSFLSPADLEYDPELLEQAVSLANPFGIEDSLLRPSLIPSLFKTAVFHEQHKISDFRGFELRSIYRQKEGKREEQASLAAVMMLERLPKWYDKRPPDFFDMKGLLESLSEHFGVSVQFEGREFASLMPGSSVAVLKDGEAIGCLGEAAPAVLEHFHLKSSLFVFEILWDRLADGISSERHYRPYSRVPQVQRDVALLVDAAVPAGQIEKFLFRQSENLVKQVRLFDLYEGGQIPEGKKSLAFSVFLGQDKTLTDEEIQAVWRRIVESLRREFHADIR